jgi:competence ComEA-like helix-hairpin-helix protein
MAQQKNHKPEYLFFTRKERIGIIAVVMIMMVYPTIPILYAIFHKPQPVDHTAFEKEIAQLNVQEPDSSSAYSKRNYDDAGYLHYQPSEKNYYDKPIKGELFYFDPNTLSADGWKKLGIREKTANTIQNYISKGGRFYKPEDIGKIWGLHEDEVKRLLPYIRIEEKPASGYNKYPERGEGKTYAKPTYTITPCDVNTSDTAAFIALPGIGNKLAARIVAFREKLGGFYKIDQLAETYGLPDSTFQKIKSRLVIGNSAVKKLNINTATVDELKTHPYLRYNIANAIVQYRNAHGNFLALNDLKKIMIITDDIYNKVAPYLSVK